LGGYSFAAVAEGATSIELAREAETFLVNRGKVQMANDGGAEQPSGHLGLANTVGDLLRHEAFKGFAALLLPWDDRAYNERMRLDQLEELLPYHSEFVPTVALNALNRMIDEAGAGRQIFYDFYADAEKLAQPTKRNAGLFFLRGKPGAPFAIIAPGGGFSYVGSVHEGFPYAAEISDRGYNAFVLKYRVGLGERAATEDLAAALSYVIRNAEQLGVSTSTIRYGAVLPVREWRPRSARTGQRNSAGATSESRQRS
jgi:hypothetical protein